MRFIASEPPVIIVQNVAGVRFRVRDMNLDRPMEYEVSGKWVPT